MGDVGVAAVELAGLGRAVPGQGERALTGVVRIHRPNCAGNTSTVRTTFPISSIDSPGAHCAVTFGLAGVAV